MSTLTPVLPINPGRSSAGRVLSRLRVILSVCIERKTFLFWICFSNLIFNSASSLAAPSVSKMFQEATVAIRSGNIATAEKILRGIINSYPSYEPAYLLLGRIEYRQGAITNAHRYFKKVSPGSLDDDAAFEYGVVFFSKNDCPRAIPALKMVGSRHSLQSYAKFYLGICYLRQRNYAQVLSALRLAKDLPPDLAALRRRTARIASDRLRIESSGFSLQQPADVIAPQPTAALGWEPLPAEPAAARKASRNSGESSRLNYSVSPAIEFKKSITDSEYSGTRESSSNETTFVGGAKLAGRYDLAIKSAGGHPNLGLGLDVSESSKGGASSDVRYFSSEDGGTETEEVAKPIDSSQALSWAVRPSAGLPISKNLDLGLQYQYQESWPDNDRAQHSSSSQPTANLTLSSDRFSLDSSASLKQDFSADSGKNTLIFKAGIASGFKTVDFGADFSMTSREVFEGEGFKARDWSEEIIVSGSIGFAMDFYTLNLLISDRELLPAEDFSGVDGAALSKLSTSMRVGANFDFGLSLTGQIAFGNFSEYSRIGLVIAEAATPEGEDTTVDVTASGSDISYNLGGRYSPLNWLFFQGNYNVTQTAYLLADEAVEPYFYQDVADFVTVITISAGISASF